MGLEKTISKKHTFIFVIKNKHFDLKNTKF